MSDLEAKLDRQEQIWAGLYGPVQARQLIEDARLRIAGNGAGSAETETIDSVLRKMDAALHDDDDPDEAGTMRPI